MSRKQPNLRRQAQLITNASLPSIGSINRQYGRASGDVQGYTQALVKLLQGSTGLGTSAYGDAIKLQQADAAAAQAQLAGLDPAYAGAAAAQTGRSSTGLNELLAGQGAANAYGAKQPGIAAARGALSLTGLQNSKLDALRQRQEDYQKAYAPTLIQLRQQAFDRSMALKGLGLQQAQFAEQQKEFGANFGLQKQQLAASSASSAASLAERKREFNASQAQQYQEWLGSQQGGGFTPVEIQHFKSDTYDGAQSAIHHGVGPQQFISEANARGIPAPVIRFIVARTYGALVKPNRTQHPQMFKAWTAYQAWIRQQLAAKARATSARNVRENPSLNRPRG